MAKTILLADDSLVVQKLVGLSFASDDFEIVSTDNGTDAIEMVRALHPQLVLADVVMPGLSGYEVCKAIKSEPELADIPVILLTRTSESFNEELARQIGANGHITKPFESQALAAQVHALLDKTPNEADTSEIPPLNIGMSLEDDPFGQGSETAALAQTSNHALLIEPLTADEFRKEDQLHSRAHPEALYDRASGPVDSPASSLPSLDQSAIPSETDWDTHDTDSVIDALLQDETKAEPPEARLNQRASATVQKLAQEAFSDLPQPLVDSIIDRIEAIAWEVVPQLAETMIREEIKKMKGESEGVK